MEHTDRHDRKSKETERVDVSDLRPTAILSSSYSVILRSVHKSAG